MRIDTGGLGLQSHPKDCCRVCTEFDSGDISERVQISLARNGQPSIRWPSLLHRVLTPSLPPASKISGLNDETAAVLAHVLCTPYNHAPCHFMQSHIRKVYACLAVTCHLHFWQNDRDLLRATAVTRGWNGYRNKSQHRKSTLEKKIVPPFQQGFEPATFQSRVRRSNH